MTVGHSSAGRSGTMAVPAGLSNARRMDRGAIRTGRYIEHEGQQDRIRRCILRHCSQTKAPMSICRGLNNAKTATTGATESNDWKRIGSCDVVFV